MPAGLDERIAHFGTIGERVHDHIQTRIPEVGTHFVSDTLDGVALELGIALGRTHLVGHVSGSVVCGVKRVDPFELDLTSTGQREVQLPALQALGEDPHGRWPGADAHRRSGRSERAYDGPAVSPVVGNACYERSFSGQIDRKH